MKTILVNSFPEIESSSIEPVFDRVLVEITDPEKRVGFIKAISRYLTPQCDAWIGKKVMIDMNAEGFELQLKDGQFAVLKATSIIGVLNG